MSGLPVVWRPDGRPEDRGGRKGSLILVLASLVLSQIPVGNAFFAVPLLLASARTPKVSRILVCHLGVVAFAVAAAAYGCWNRATGAFSSGLFLLSVHMPVVLGVGSAIWSCAGLWGFGARRRFLLSGAFAVLAAAAVVLVLSGGGAAAKDLESGLAFAYGQMFGSLGGLTGEDFFRLFLGLAQLLLVPVSALLLGFTILVAESTWRKADLAWQSRAARWSVPEDFVWVLLASFFAAIAAQALRLPAAVRTPLWNAAALTCVVYASQGFAILAFLLRRRNPFLPAHRLAINLAMLSLVPGLNLVVLAGLPLLGALETWITFRKPNKENSYEDHFESGRA